jgi:glycosyltransferase involved in cell wall biosynthesis
MQTGVWLFKLFGKRFFCATPQSLPMYAKSPKKVVVGHGIDLDLWKKRENMSTNPHKLLVVHRLSRSKRVELTLQALALLDAEYTVDIYGIEAEADYAAELKKLVSDVGLTERVTFHGTIPMAKLSGIYTAYRLIVNMASETIDKTMLEAMTCGCYPITTAANAKAIGLTAAPTDDTPKAIADFVRQYAVNSPMTADEMYSTVERGHSLSGLINKMDAYIRGGK